MLSAFLLLIKGFEILPLIQMLTSISSAKLTRTLIGIVIMSIVEAEAFYEAGKINDPEEENKEKERIFTEELKKSYAIIDKNYDYSDSVDSFINNIFIPKVKDFSLPLLKKLGFIKKLDPNQIKKIIDPNFIGPIQ